MKKYYVYKNGNGFGGGSEIDVYKRQLMMLLLV